MTLSPPPVQPSRPPRPARLPSITNGIDVTAFILAFLLPLVGAIIGMVAISEAHKQGRQASGLAVAGVVIGWVAVAAVVIVVIAVVASQPSAPDPAQQLQNCLQNAIANGTDASLCTPPP
jgi:uncharacterized membrane protein